MTDDPNNGYDERLDGATYHSDPLMNARQWHVARKATWRLWLARLEEDGRLGRAAHLWPPHDAKHDRIVGEIFHRYYANPFAQRGEVLRLAEEGLAEVENASAAARAAVPGEYLFRLRGLVAWGTGELGDDVRAYVGLMRVGIQPLA